MPVLVRGGRVCAANAKGLRFGVPTKVAKSNRPDQAWPQRAGMPRGRTDTPAI